MHWHRKSKICPKSPDYFMTAYISVAQITLSDKLRSQKGWNSCNC